MQSKQGFTLIELLISSTILLVILTFAFQGVVWALQIQARQEQESFSQAKLRRATEVLEQQIRGATLGGLAQKPYNPDQTSISFASMKGGAGYQVIAVNASSIEIIASALPTDAFDSKQALLVGSTSAVLLDVSSVSDKGGGIYEIGFANCSTAPALSNDMRLHESQLVGFDFDSLGQTLKMQLGQSGELDVAYDINSVQFNYIYVNNAGTLTDIRTTPYQVAGIPQKNQLISGENYSLRRVELNIETAGQTNKEDYKRSYTSIIELGDIAGNDSSGQINIDGVRVCN